MKILTSPFGTMSDGTQIVEYTLETSKGSSLSVLSYGATISKLYVPDKHGSIKNVVLGFLSLEEYQNHNYYLGASIGRVAGRITNGSFPLHQEVYTTSKNENMKTLHGGCSGFNEKVWSVTQIEKDTEATLVMNYMSPDNEEGFPGNLDVSIHFTFTEDNELTIQYSATTDKTTYVNLTNHSYFNLSGDFTTTIQDHELCMDASNYIALDEDSLPTGITSVENTPFDFRSLKSIGKDIRANDVQISRNGGYDHPFMLDETDFKDKIYAVDSSSGRTLTIATSEPSVVLYTGNALSSKDIVCDGIHLQPHSAFCLETQHYPDCLHHDFLESKILEPNEVYRSKTTYRFGILS